MNHTLKPLGALMAGLAFCSHSALAADTTSKDGKTDGVLPSVEVNANRDQPAYVTTKTRVGKVEQDPHEIPQAVTTVTSTLLQEQQASSLQEAMRNVSGISFNAAEGGRAGDNMNLRGFYTFGDMYLDGIRDTAQYNRETFNFEQLDVLRGAGAMLFGRGQAGGVINQVTKTPLEFDQYRLTASTGSNGYRLFAADLNKSISEDIGLRVNLMDRAEGSWRSNPYNGAEPDVHRTGAAISLALNQSQSNRFWVNHYQLRTRDNPDYGLPFDSNTRRPSKTFYNAQNVATDPIKPTYFWGNKNTFDNSDTSISTLVHELKLSPDTVWRNQLRHADYDRSYWAIAPEFTLNQTNSNGILGGSNKTRMVEYKTTTLQSDLASKFTLWGMNHQTITGFEYLREDNDRRSLAPQTTSAPPLYRPYVGGTTGINIFKGDSYALYAQDTIEFVPKWKVTAGARFDRLDAAYRTSSGNWSSSFSEWSYRSALSYHPTDESHYYLAWSDSFSPTADLYQLGSTNPAERSDVIELGSKYILFEGDLTLRGAIYRANKEWERNADLEATTAPILTKKRRTDGIEVEAAGRITRNWEIFTGVAVMDPKILAVANGAAPVFVGKRARNAPNYTFNLWTTYRIDENWRIGGGIEGKGDRDAFSPTTATTSGTYNTRVMQNGVYSPNRVPSYYRVDALLSYEQAKWAVKVNCKNMFDQLYYDSVYDNGGFTVPGLRRTVIVTAEFKY